ncbi:MAG: MFS transporter [Candidatus Bathyarchaeia archaeon]
MRNRSTGAGSNQHVRDNGFRNVLSLGLVSFFTDVSSEMCLGLLPTFILQELRGTLGILGFIEGLAESFSYTLRMVSGVISDRFKRRKLFVFIGYSLSTVIKPVFAVAQSWVDVLVVRVGDRVGKGVRTAPRDALLSESISGERMGEAFGLHRTLDQLGAIVGPLIASSLMLSFAMTIRTVFWLSFIPGFIAITILVAFVKERRGEPRSSRFLIDVRRVLKERFIILLIIIGTFSMGAFNFSFILVKAGELNIDEAFIPLVYGIVNVGHTIAAIPAGVLSDMFGKERLLIIGYCIFLSSTLSLLLYGNPLYAYLIAFVYGVYFGIIETVQRAIIPSYVPEDLRGTGYGLYYLATGSSFFVSNTVFGILWENIGVQASVLYSVVTTTAAIIWMFLFLKKII